MDPSLAKVIDTVLPDWLVSDRLLTTSPFPTKARDSPEKRKSRSSMWLASIRKKVPWLTAFVDRKRVPAALVLPRTTTGSPLVTPSEASQRTQVLVSDMS